MMHNPGIKSSKGHLQLHANTKTMTGTSTSTRTEAEAKAKRIGKVSWGGAAADVLLHIFARLPAASLAHVSAVCTSWHNVVVNCSFLWKKGIEEQEKELKFRFPKLDITLTKELDSKTRAIAMRQRVHLVHGTMDSRWWKAHPSRVDCCRMNMDTIVSGSIDQTIRVWSATSLHCLEEYKVPKPKSAIVDLEFDLNKIVAAAGTEVWIWNRNRGGRVTHKMGGHSLRLYCLGCTESEVAVGCADGTARIYDLYGGRCSRILRCHSAAVSTLCIQEEMQLLASGSRDGSVQVCDSSSGDIVARLLRPNSMREVECLQWGRNGHFLFAGTSVGRLCCWDIRKQSILWQECHDKSVMKSLHLQEYAPETLVTGSMDGRVRMWDSSGKILKTFRPSDSSRADASAESSWSETVVPLRGVSNNSSVMVPPKQAPILCVRVGSTRVLTSHTDGSLALCQFQI
ncbi:hypothetical protein KC19_10G045500 [Ceratodon purpureus]|uniref:F-box domain-containing protein n=1 Tax=Ceratodon purpureus TaxID=3225 RepID=A0A8T0GNS3_CERPU|nr:hypothetical protein KC19_10G045500 [Ceratodon purpureus]